MDIDSHSFKEMWGWMNSKNQWTHSGPLLTSLDARPARWTLTQAWDTFTQRRSSMIWRMRKRIRSRAIRRSRRVILRRERKRSKRKRKVIKRRRNIKKRRRGIMIKEGIIIRNRLKRGNVRWKRIRRSKWRLIHRIVID